MNDNPLFEIFYILFWSSLAACAIYFGQPYSIKKLNVDIANCEKNLPRSLKCVPKAVPEKTHKKEGV